MNEEVCFPLVNIDRRKFDSAQSAFEHLNADSKPFYRLAYKKLIQLRTAWETLNLRVNPDVIVRTVPGMISRLLGQENAFKLSYKKWKCVKVKNSDDVCFYSDTYNGIDLKKAELLASACRNVRLEVRIFEWDYPGLDFLDGYFPRRPTKVISGGYAQLYRGKLVGLVLGAYNNPYEGRTKKGSCKRKRLSAM